MTVSAPSERSGSSALFAACCWRVSGARECVNKVRGSSGLILDGLSRYDPEKLLTAQAQEEGLAQKLDPSRVISRLRAPI